MYYGKHDLEARSPCDAPLSNGKSDYTHVGLDMAIEKLDIFNWLVGFFLDMFCTSLINAADEFKALPTCSSTPTL